MAAMRDDSTKASSSRVFRHRPTRLTAFDETCLGLPVGALAEVTGRHAIDVDLFVDALRRADPDVALLDVQYETVMKKYRSILEELRTLQTQARPVIVRCSSPMESARAFDGEEALVRALGAVARMYPQPIVLAWRGRPGDRADDVDATELWMASKNVVTVVDARRDDEEDDIPGIAHDEMVGDLMFDVAFFDPRSKEVEYQSLNAHDLMK